jgi:hypothetical protein
MTVATSTPASGTSAIRMPARSARRRTRSAVDAVGAARSEVAFVRSGYDPRRREPVYRGGA